MTFTHLEKRYPAMVARIKEKFRCGIGAMIVEYGEGQHPGRDPIEELLEELFHVGHHVGYIDGLAAAGLAVVQELSQTPKWSDRDGEDGMYEGAWIGVLSASDAVASLLQEQVEPKDEAKHAEKP